MQHGQQAQQHSPMSSCVKHHHEHANHSHMIADFKKRLWIALFLTIPVVLLSPMIQRFFLIEGIFSFPGDTYIVFILSTTIYGYGGWPFLTGMRTELQNRQPGMMTLIAIAISVAYFYSDLVMFGLQGEVFFWELATLIDIMLLGHWIEMKSILGAGKALEKLSKLMPAVAHRLNDDGSTQDVTLDILRIDDRVLAKPGEKIPADGIVIAGISSVNESMLTGESKPVLKQIGAQVIAGAINGEGALTIQVKKTDKDSYLAQVIELVKLAQESKSRTQDIANRAASWLTLIALTGGSITLMYWLGFTDATLAFALERTVTVMIITCPHALGLAVPLVIAVSTAIAAHNGLLIRNRAAFESARKINAIVFDKTGTLTEGQFGITDILLFTTENFDEQALLNYAAAIESHSEHLIAKGIVQSAHLFWEVTNFKAIPGIGAQGVVHGHSVKVVSPSFIQTNTIEINQQRQVNELMVQGKTVVFVLIDDMPIGAIALADMIRKESKDAIKQLKKMNIHCMMLTGDNKQAAKWVAEGIGIDEYFAEVLPQDKAAKIKEVSLRGLTVAMIGDGINDAPALAQADVGIAIGAGTDVAIATADIILVKNNLMDVVATIALARATTRKMIQNLLWATGYNALAMPLAAGILFNYGILLSPALGAVLMSLSTIIVAVNAKLLRIK